MSKFTTAKSLHCAVAKTTCVRLPPATSAALFSTISLTMRLVTSSRPLHKSASSQEHKYMPYAHRQEKLGELIAVELSELIRTRLKDPRIGFASITHVEVSGDLRHAKVFVSVMGTEKEQTATIQALKHATGFLRSQLASRITLRYMPELVFKLDTSIEQGTRILELIREIENEKTISGETYE